MAEKIDLSVATTHKGTIGNVGVPGAPVVNFVLTVNPSSHKVVGFVEVSQATANGNYSGNVAGTIYATGYGNFTQIVYLKGLVHPDAPVPIEIPFEAHMAIDNAWNGIGGFNYSNVHVEKVPVKPLN